MKTKKKNLKKDEEKNGQHLRENERGLS